MNGLIIAEIVLVCVFLLNVIMYLITDTEFFVTVAVMAFIMMFVLGMIIHLALNVKFIEFLGSGGLG
jgi:hypothetical protein